MPGGLLEEKRYSQKYFFQLARPALILISMLTKSRYYSVLCKQRNLQTESTLDSFFKFPEEREVSFM